MARYVRQRDARNRRDRARYPERATERAAERVRRNAETARIARRPRQRADSPTAEFERALDRASAEYMAAG